MSADILQEVQEAFAHTKDKLVGMQHMMRADSVLKNEIELYSINEYALEKAVAHGVDPHLQSEMAKSSVVSSVMTNRSGTFALQGGGSDPVLEEQLSILVNYLNARDLSLILGVDTEEGDYSSRDILLSMKLPKKVFEPLLKPVKNSRPALHKTLLSQPLISGESKLSTISKKKRRGLLTELKSKQKKSKSRSSSLGEHPDGGSGNDEADKQRSLLAAAVGKGVAEETMTSYLTLVCLLLNVMKEQRIKGGSSGSSGGRKAAEGPAAPKSDEHLPLSSIPVANVIGALFEKRGNPVSDSEASESVPNPFRKFLLSTLDASSSAKKGVDPVAVSQAESEGEEEEEDESRQAMSEASVREADMVGVHEQAQSEAVTAPEGGIAPHPGVNRDGGASVDEGGLQRSPRTDITIRSDVATVSLSGVSDTGSIAFHGTLGANSETTSHAGTIDYVDHDGEVDEEMILAAGEAGRPRLGGGSSSSSVSGGGSRGGSSPVPAAGAGQNERIGTPVGETLPDVPLLATYGPFCTANMHRVIEQEGISLNSSIPHIPAIPLQDVVVALLAALAASADHKLGLRSAPCRTKGNGQGGRDVAFDGSSSAEESLKDPLTSRLSMTPNAVNLMLVEYSLDILFNELTDLSETLRERGDSRKPTVGEKEGEGEKSSPGSRVHFLSWCIGAVLKTLCASLQVASETNLPANSLGLGVVSPDVMKTDKTTTTPPTKEKDRGQAMDAARGGAMEGGADAGAGADGSEKADKPGSYRRGSRKRGSNGSGEGAAGSTGDPFVFRLLRKIAACMGLPVGVAGGYEDCVNRALTSPGITKAAHTSGPVSSHLCRHYLSIVGIDVFVSGLTYFFPLAVDRGMLLQTLLKSAPKYSMAAQYCNFISPYVVSESDIGSVGQHKDASGFYLLVCLQKLCGALSKDGKVFNFARTLAPRVRSAEYGMPSSTGHSAGDSPQSVAQSPLFAGSPDKHKGAGGQSSRRYLVSTGPDSKRGGHYRRRRDQKRDSDNMSGGKQAGADVCLELTLLERISEWDLMQHSRTQQQSVDTAAQSLFWGEMQLLRSLQKKHAEVFFSSLRNAEKKHLDFCFDGRRCSGNILITAESTSISHRSHKNWSTALGAKSMPPNSGVYEWVMEVEICEKGHVFLGVATDQANLDSYVGCDRHGWGLIGTKALWHNKQKVLTNYGSGFQGKSKVSLRYDSDQHTLSYFDTSKEWGVAFSDLPINKTMYPAVSVFQQDDVVTICRNPHEGNLEKPGTSRLRRSWLLYSQTVFSHSISLLQHALSATTRSSVVGPDLRASKVQELVICHPFIGLLVPSILASLASKEMILRKSESGIVASVQLLPSLTVMAKLLSAVYDSRPNRQPDQDLLGNMSGAWRMKTPKGTVPGGADTYQMRLSATPLGIDDEESEDSEDGERASEGKESKSYVDTGDITTIGFSKGSVLLTGSGRSVAANVMVKGAQVGSRVKFGEMWTMDDRQGVVEGAVSMCGSYFKGVFTDMKGNNRLELVGVRPEYTESGSRARTRTLNGILLKTCALSMIACSRLSCQLMLGVQPSTDSAAASQSTAVVSAGAGGLEADTESAGAGNGDLSATGGERHGERDADKNKDESSLHWLECGLFSGGLVLDAQLKADVASCILEYSQSLGDAATSEEGEYAEESHDENAGLEEFDRSGYGGAGTPQVEEARDLCLKDSMKWWLAAAFPMAKTTGQATLEEDLTARAVPALGPEDTDTEADGIIKKLPRTESAERLFETEEGFLPLQDGAKLDDYISHHTGQTMLRKVGGEPMQRARRLVLAALARHMGCLSLCVAEVLALSNNDKTTSDRPCEPLLDLWRGAKRVLEHIVKKKQETGLHYSFLCEPLAQKASLLLDIAPSSACVEIADEINMLYDVAHVDCWTSEAGIEAQQGCSKLLSEAVDFLLSTSPVDITSVREHLRCRNLTAIMRSAGFRALLLLLQKQEELVDGAVKLPAIVSPWLQAYAATYLCDSVPHSSPSSATKSKNGSGGNSQGDSKSVLSHEPQHHTFGLHGASPELLDSLATSFESALSFFTSVLQRCTWNGDNHGISVLLRVWRDLRVNPSDHSWLNQVGIFRVLQTVLETVRRAKDTLAVEAGSSQLPPPSHSTGEKSRVAGGDDATKFARDLNEQASRHLSQMALQVVHSLAAQVAFSDEVEKPRAAHAVKLQRSVSGPDTLSQSLFDMLFNELYNSIREELLRVESGDIASQEGASASASGQNSSRGSQPRGTDSASGADEDPNSGDKYLFQLLRLLYTVSNSKVCQRSLSSPKWMTLLVSFIGFGSFSVQRRVMRLLRRILVGLDPTTLETHVPPLFSNEKLAMLGDACLDDEEARSLMHMNHSRGPSRSCDLLVLLFLHGVSMVIPTLDEEGKDKRLDSLLAQHLNRTRGARSFSVECLNVLRELQGMPKWRRVIANALQGELTVLNEADAGEDRERPASQMLERHLRCISSMSLLGGFIDGFRLGGKVLIRPFNFVESNSTYASILAASGHTSGMVVSKGASHFDLVEMESFNKLSLDPASGEVIIQQGAYLIGNLPVRTVRVNSADVTATSDVMVFPEVITSDVFSHVVKILDGHSVPWWRATNETLLKTSLAKSKTGGEGEHEDGPVGRDSEASTGGLSEDDEALLHLESGEEHEVSDSQAVETLLHTFAFKSLAHLVQSPDLSSDLLSSNPDLFLHVLQVAVEETRVGGLNVVEEVESRWNALWDAYVKTIIHLPEDEGGDPGGNQESLSSSVRHGAGAGTDGPGASLQALLDSTARGGQGSRLVEITPASLLAALTQQADSGPGGGGLSRSPRSSEQGGGTGDSGGSMSRSILLEAAAAAGIFNPFLGARQPRVDEATQSAAIAQMVDIGLPPEWCEVALRRCRWNVEMAINLCFEHGDGMAQLVAEDAMLQQAQANQPSRGVGGSGGNFGGPGGGRRERRGSDGPHSSAQSSRRRSSGGTYGARGDSGGRVVRDDGPFVRQLMDMGFPQTWCERALRAAGGDVDGALSYILSHGDELGASGVEDDNPGEDGGDEGRGEAASIAPPINPLNFVSGRADIRPDLTCVGDEGFPSIGCRGYGVSTGKWYYEVTLVTSGCVQIGWVDQAYASDPASGEGVGDCKHSWAYDGWRMHVWNELPIDWGARWSTGDVVGCMLDMDARIMRFSLNGYEKEVGMGVAFSNFAYSGGLFPCASFNRQESIRFNFGGSPFLKGAPPAGFLPFEEHVKAVRGEALSLHRKISMAPLHRMMHASEDEEETEHNADGDMCGNGDLTERLLMDSYEEAGSDPYFRSGGSAAATQTSRYFYDTETISGEGQQGGRNLPRNPRATFSEDVPSARGEILTQLREVSKDLCILYSRCAALHVLNSVKGSGSEEGGEEERIEVGSNTARALLDLLMTSIKGDEGDEKAVLSDSETKNGRKPLHLHNLLNLLKLCAVTSSRTRSHNLLMSLLPPMSAFPRNLGSVYSSGGAPLLSYLSAAMADFVAVSREAGEDSVIDELLELILLEATSSIDRAYVDRWEDKRGLAPVIVQDGSDESAVLRAPSLLVALWLTSILTDQFAAELTSGEQEGKGGDTGLTSSQALIGKWLEALVQHWGHVLRTAAVPAKLCATQVILTIVQGIASTTGNLRLPHPYMATILEHLDYKRLCQHVLTRLDAERGTHPVCSEYLQALMELTSVMHHCRTMIDAEERGDAGVPPGSPISFPPLESEGLDKSPGEPTNRRQRAPSIAAEPPTNVNDGTEEGTRQLYEDCEEEDYDWEALRGQVISENGWNIYTGTLTQLAVEGWTQEQKKHHDRQDSAPELLPGRKVVRRVTFRRKVVLKRPKVITSGDSEKDEGKQTTSGESHSLLGGTVSEPWEALPTTTPVSRADSDARGEGIESGTDESQTEADSADHAWGIEGSKEADELGDPEPVVEVQYEEVEELVEETRDQLGTVLTVAAWRGTDGELRSPGTARLVAWEPVSLSSPAQNTSAKRSILDAAAGAGTIDAWVQSTDAGPADEINEGVRSVASERHSVMDADTEAPGRSEELMRWDVCSGDFGGMRQVEVNGSNEIERYLPLPLTQREKLALDGFGQELHFGIILRIRKLPLVRGGNSDQDGDVENRLVGILELPDFNAEVLVEGHFWRDGTITFEERKLLCGTPHATWVARFGQAGWRPGTTYEMHASRSNAETDRTDPHQRSYLGSVSYTVALGQDKVVIAGDLEIQSSHLFHFDDRMKSSFMCLSLDKRSAFRPPRVGGGNNGCVFGNIGFSSGVHYWEVKIESADVGSVFIGVSEKNQPPGINNTGMLRRKIGVGIISNRTAYRAGGMGVAERAYAYGENFHAGDTVGVHLDMNRGTLSFFLDGLKYGEHSITDLGTAFDCLRNRDKAKPRTYYPIVGLFSGQDRVTLTPRWLSTMGTRCADELDYVDKTWNLLNSWSLERKTHNQPASMHLWVYRDAWRNWLQWRACKRSRVRTRCKSIPIDINVTPRACAEASIRLGLRRALYRGDRFSFVRSQGRTLDMKEDAVVLGAYRGELWYRLDTQQGDAQGDGPERGPQELIESGSVAWCLAQADVEDILIAQRLTTDSTSATAIKSGVIPRAIRSIELARTPAHQGALILITCESGSVMRDGIEIDAADEVSRIPPGTRLLAIERRRNSSNITRFRVIYEGQVGWISERMRGGTEDMMLEYSNNAPASELEDARQELLVMADSLGMGVDSCEFEDTESSYTATGGSVIRKDVGSLSEAMEEWDNAVSAAGFGYLCKPCASSGGDVETSDQNDIEVTSDSFEAYLELATTQNGSKQWSVEADMQLSELISLCASKNGVVPANLSVQTLKTSLREIDSLSSPLFGIDFTRAIARAALLRVANNVVGHALPYLSLILPEEKAAFLNGKVTDDSINVVTSDLSPLQSEEDFLANEDAIAAATGPGSVAGRSSPGSPGGRRKTDIMPAGSPGGALLPSTPTSASFAQARARAGRGRPLRRANSSGLHIAPLPAEEGGEEEAHESIKHHRVLEAGKGFTAPESAPFANEWAPSCSARRLRSLRRLLFSQTKVLFWESILEATTSPTTLNQDEYEDPREIRTLDINRVMATKGALSSVSNPVERLKQTVFGQLHKEMRNWDNSAYRRSYLGKGHGGQRRAFKVQFKGEGVHDYGGPYRALFEQIVDEMQMDQFSVGKKASERSLLPLLAPCQNRSVSVGANQDKFVLTTGPTMPLVQELMVFFGKVVGTAARHNLTLGIDFSALQWRSLVRLPLSSAHLETVDLLTVSNLNKVRQRGLREEYLATKAARAGGARGGEGEAEAVDLGDEYCSRVPEEWQELRFSTYLPDGSKKELLPGGDTLPVNLGNWRNYVSLMEVTRLKESAVMLKAFKNGLAAVLPVELLPLFTAREIEEVISGHSDVNLDLLKRCTEYDDIDPQGETARNFWRVIEGFNNEERTLFLRFVWARSRLPTSVQGFDMHFRLQGPQAAAKEADNGDNYLPHAQTCFFSLSLPNYSSYERMREKLLYAIHNSPNMDADVRLHSAEGFDI